MQGISLILKTYPYPLTLKGDSPMKNNRGTVLVVDDERLNLKFLFRALKKAGFKVLGASDAETALERIRHTLPDIILLDIVMPGMDGFELCRRLKSDERTKDIPVIFMTGLSDTLDEVRGFRLGAADYVTKPFRLKTILARIHTHLTMRNMQKRLQAKNIRLEREINERKQTEEKLCQSERKYKELVQNANSIILRATPPVGDRILQ